MTRSVFCRKYQRSLEGLEAPPLPGQTGQAIFESVSKRAWMEWQRLQTMLINEKHLSLLDRDARDYLLQQMEKFLNNEPVDYIEGYVAPDAPVSTPPEEGTP